jgi:hypothetical protein
VVIREKSEFFFAKVEIFDGIEQTVGAGHDPETSTRW